MIISRHVIHTSRVAAHLTMPISNRPFSSIKYIDSLLPKELERGHGRLSRFVQSARDAVASENIFKPLLVGIDTQSLVHNVNHLANRAGHRKLCVVLKGDAEGHGIENVAPTVEPYVHSYGIVDNWEASEIRKSLADPEKTIMRVKLASDIEMADAVANNLNIEESIGSLARAEQFNAICQSADVIGHIHLVLDSTGLGRNGFPTHDFTYLCQSVEKMMALPNIKITGIYSHFPNANNVKCLDKSDATVQQANRFIDHASELKNLIIRQTGSAPMLHLFASAGHDQANQILSEEHAKLLDLDRIGRSLYGGRSHETQSMENLKQCMHVMMFVSEVFHRPAGSTIGYDSLYTVTNQEGEHLANLGAGWYNLGKLERGKGESPDNRVGYVTNLTGGKHPFVGKVSMNISTIAGEDENGRRLSPNEPVFLTTSELADHVTGPSVDEISIKQGVSQDYVTSQLAARKNTIRFRF